MAENLCYTAMKKFQDKYGIIPNVSDHEYFTNSMHIPVWEKVDMIEKINIESQLTGYSNAGKYIACLYSNIKKKNRVNLAEPRVIKNIYS